MEEKKQKLYNYYDYRIDNNDNSDNTIHLNDNNLQDMGLPADLERVDGAMRWGHNDKTYFFSGGIFSLVALSGALYVHMRSKILMLFDNLDVGTMLISFS